MGDTSLKKLLFPNGYYDGVTGLFNDKDTYGFDPTIYFKYSMPHPFEPASDEDEIYKSDIK
jgi:hypothetical protein